MFHLVASCCLDFCATLSFESPVFQPLNATERQGLGHLILPQGTQSPEEKKSHETQSPVRKSNYGYKTRSSMASAAAQSSMSESSTSNAMKKGTVLSRFSK